MLVCALLNMNKSKACEASWSTDGAELASPLKGALYLSKRQSLTPKIQVSAVDLDGAINYQKVSIRLVKTQQYRLSPPTNRQ